MQRQLKSIIIGTEQKTLPATHPILRIIYPDTESANKVAAEQYSPISVTGTAPQIGFVAPIRLLSPTLLANFERNFLQLVGHINLHKLYPTHLSAVPGWCHVHQGSFLFH
jgi:hypothetical protein